MPAPERQSFNDTVNDRVENIHPYVGLVRTSVQMHFLSLELVEFVEF